MFSKSRRFYDKLYSWKDYDAEAERLREVIEARHRNVRSLLDVACGTGRHLELFRRWVPEVAGLDLDEGLLAIAGERAPDVALHRGDMTGFDLGRRFDAITCLFSSIGYARTVVGLKRAIGCMARHLEPGGLLLVEPWFRLEDFRAGHIGYLTIDEPELKVTRMNVVRLTGREWRMEMHYLVGTPDAVEHVVEAHVLSSFNDDEFRAAFRGADLAEDYVADGAERGLWIGRSAVRGRS